MRKHHYNVEINATARHDNFDGSVVKLTNGLTTRARHIWFQNSAYPVFTRKGRIRDSKQN